MIKKLLCGLLAAAMCLSLCACAESAPDAPASDQATPAPVPTATPAPAAPAASDTPDKEETVYVEADASGHPREVTVETVLNYAGKNGSVEDMTNLTDIKNTEGDEEFTLGKDGSLLWEDHGEKIRYEGRSGKDLPVTVAVAYWLDGTVTEPAALAGRSGHVRIRFDYENHTAETVTVTHAKLDEDDEEDKTDNAGEASDDDKAPETEEIVTPIPFLAVSLAMLPEDTFSNVTVTNGRLLSLEGQSIALGYALPGLDEALSLTDFEPTEDAEIPSYVEIEADVTDFSLDFTATIVTNGLLDELEEEDLDDLEKLSLGMGKLAEASEKLADGTRELSDGAGEYADYIAEYIRGVWQLYSGADTLHTALAAMSEQTAPLRTGAAAASSGLSELRGVLDTIGLPDMTDTASALEAVIAALDAFQAEIDALPGYADSVSSAVATANDALAGIDANSLYAVLDSADLTDEQRELLSAALTENIDAIMSSVDNARYYLGQVPAVLSGPELAAYAATLSQAAASLRASAAEALASADQFPSSPEEAMDQLDALVSGITALCDAVNALADGSSDLSGGAYALAAAGDALEDAAYTLADGASSLADGMAEFDEEGIREMTDLADDGLVTLVTQVRALREADIAYDNFGGIADGRTGSVRFIIETDSIG